MTLKLFHFDRNRFTIFGYKSLLNKDILTAALLPATTFDGVFNSMKNGRDT